MIKITKKPNAFKERLNNTCFLYMRTKYVLIEDSLVLVENSEILLYFIEYSPLKKYSFIAKLFIRSPTLVIIRLMNASINFIVSGQKSGDEVYKRLVKLIIFFKA